MSGDYEPSPPQTTQLYGFYQLVRQNSTNTSYKQLFYDYTLSAEGFYSTRFERRGLCLAEPFTAAKQKLLSTI